MVQKGLDIFNEIIHVLSSVNSPFILFVDLNYECHSFLPFVSRSQEWFNISNFNCKQRLSYGYRFCMNFKK